MEPEINNFNRSEDKFNQNQNNAIQFNAETSDDINIGINLLFSLTLIVNILSSLFYLFGDKMEIAWTGPFILGLPGFLLTFFSLIFLIIRRKSLSKKWKFFGIIAIFSFSLFTLSTNKRETDDACSMRESFVTHVANNKTGQGESWAYDPTSKTYRLINAPTLEAEDNPTYVKNVAPVACSDFTNYLNNR